MTVDLFLQRTKVSPARNEYLYLTAETMEASIDYPVWSAALAGNNSASLSGDASTNFIVDLGRVKTILRVSGFIVPVSGTDFPVLSSPNIHIVSGAQAMTTQPGSAIRNALYDFVADQSRAISGFSDIIFGWPRWSATQDPRLWHGKIINLRSVEVAGEPDQYMYSFDFQIGRIVS